MKTKPDKDIEKLNPEFKDKVKLFLWEVNKDSEIIFITEATRSWDRQKELYNLWLSKTIKSNHQLWLAIDIWFKWKELYPVDINIWRKVVSIANKYWIDWGYDLWGWDKPHFQNWSLKILQINNWENMSKYTEILNNEIKNWYVPIFENKTWTYPITEQEVKELIDIAIARLSKRK
jgi:hypothetical protein